MKNQMSFFSYAAFQALICFLLIDNNYSAPINSSVTYANFLKEIKHDNCVFPKNVALPFNSPDTFEYLGVHIKICSPSEKKLKRSREAITLCSDIFNILKNITCHPDTKVQLPEIKVEFSSNVCANVSSLEFPSVPQTLLQHLKDSLVCDMMCDDEFYPACQVLLWSYQVQQQLNRAIAEQKKSEVKETVDNGNLESAKIDVKLATKKDEVNSGNVDNSLNVPSDQKLTPGEMEKSNNVVLPKNSTTQIKEDLNNADSETVNHMEKDKTNKSDILTKAPLMNVVENPEKINLPIKEEVNNEISKDNTKSDGDNQNLVNVDESLQKLNVIKVDNPKKTSIINKTNQLNNNNNDNKPVPEKAGLIDEEVPKNQNTGANGNLPETAINSNKGESKMKAHTVGDIETSVGKTDPQTKEILKVTLEKTKDTKISTLKTEEDKIGGAEEAANQNSLSESSTVETNNIEDVSPVTTAADLEKMEDENEIPEPSDKNQEPYNDMESEGDYSKLDYDDADDGFYDSSKNKKTDLVEDSKMPVVESQNELPKYDVYQSRNSIGRGVEDIQVIPAFPEQEDSHFFFYFLSLVLILMGGYLLFHNKQKIIALIVEGRHERRRRSHGVGYKKLETK